jgi:hypothetical protein
VSGGSGEIRRAFSDGIAEGVRQHVPATVGVLVRGLAVMLLVAVAHYGLGISLDSITLRMAGSPYPILSILV